MVCNLVKMFLSYCSEYLTVPTGSHFPRNGSWQPFCPAAVGNPEYISLLFCTKTDEFCVQLGSQQTIVSARYRLPTSLRVQKRLM